MSCYYMQANAQVRLIYLYIYFLTVDGEKSRDQPYAE